MKGTAVTSGSQSSIKKVPTPPIIKYLVCIPPYILTRFFKCFQILGGFFIWIPDVVITKGKT